MVPNPHTKAQSSDATINKTTKKRWLMWPQRIPQKLGPNQIQLSSSTQITAMGNPPTTASILLQTLLLTEPDASSQWRSLR